jgi:hypothetical protein
MLPSSFQPPTLAQHLLAIGAALPTDHARTQLATYVEGLLSELTRKSVYPIAAAHAVDQWDAERRHTSLLYFLRDAVWDDTAVRRAAERVASEAFERRHVPTSLVVDELVIVKKGDESVGVALQAGDHEPKPTNCQVLPTLAVGCGRELVPVDCAVYLPPRWVEDPLRRKRARIPSDRSYRSRVELAADLLDAAKARGLLTSHVFLSGAFAASVPLRAHVRAMGRGLVCALPPSTSAVRRGGDGRPSTVEAIGASLPDAAFEAAAYGSSRGGVPSSYASVDVDLTDGVAQLLVERPADASVAHRHVCLAFPQRLSHPYAVRTAQLGPSFREGARDLDARLGLSHFEGRSLPALQHHLTAVLVAASFLASQRG